MPALTATVVWQWLFDTQHGLVNWMLTRLGGDFAGHGWLAEPLSFFFVATIVVTWMGIPFVAFTMHAGMSQIPAEVLEAAAIDGASGWERFRDIVLPALQPLILVLAALSTLWDLKVFTQIYVLQQAGGITRETNLLGVWAYRMSIGQSDFGIGAAAALIMVAITLVLTIVYLRSMLRTEDLLVSGVTAARSRWLVNGAGVVVLLAFAFPVYWMVVTSFRRPARHPGRPPSRAGAADARQLPRRVRPRVLRRRGAEQPHGHRSLTVVLALLVAFLAALAISRFRFSGGEAFIIIVLLVQMVPAEALVISLFKVLDGWAPDQHDRRPHPRLPRVRPAVHHLDAAGLRRRHPCATSRRRRWSTGPAACGRSSRSRSRSSRPASWPPGIFAFIQAWNEFIFALVIMNRPDRQTLPVWLQAFNEGARGTDWGGVMAGSTLITIPVLVFFLLVHRRVTQRADRRRGEGMTPWTALDDRLAAGDPAGLVRRARGRRRGCCAGVDDGLGGVCLFGSNLTGRAARAWPRSLHARRPDVVVATDEEGGDVTRLRAATGSPVPGRAPPSAPSTTRRSPVGVPAALGAELSRRRASTSTWPRWPTSTSTPPTR